MSMRVSAQLARKLEPSKKKITHDFDAGFPSYKLLPLPEPAVPGFDVLILGDPPPERERRDRDEREKKTSSGPPERIMGSQLLRAHRLFLASKQSRGVWL